MFFCFNIVKFSITFETSYAIRYIKAYNTMEILFVSIKLIGIYAHAHAAIIRTCDFLNNLPSSVVLYIYFIEEKFE